MLEEELINKASEYLKKEKIYPLENSVEYLLLRKNVPQKNGKTKDMHIIGFLADFNKESDDGVKGGSIYINAETNKLSFIVTPYYMSDINE